MNFKKHYLLIIALFSITFLNAQPRIFANGGKISPRLASEMIQNPDEWHEVSVLLTDRVDVESLRKQFDAEKTSLEVRTATVINLLKQKAATTQPQILQILENNPAVDNSSVHAFWIVNMIKFKAKTHAITLLSNYDAIHYLDINAPLALDEFTTENCEDSETSLMAVNGREVGLSAIKAPQMWALGYTGFGTRALSIDTGVERDHPAFSYKYHGLLTNDSQSWFDFNGGSTTPNDCDGHGTHTVGTMLGLDRENNDTIGVAFDATWMGSQAICGGGSTDNIATFQWAMDPDNNPNTIDDMPTVICNSWYDPSAQNSQCGGTYQNLFDALEAVGVAVVFSAGNDGAGASTITAPKNVNNDLVSVFCVGALNVSSTLNQSIASFSSRGPSTCGDTGSYLIKPEVSAPGVSVRSADLGGIYSLKSGTSMAAPHVAGAVLLLKQAFPTLPGRDIKLALYFSAIDLGDPGEDNDYGMGAIDVYAAYQYLINEGNIPANPYANRDLAAQDISLDEVICSANLSVTPSANFVNYGTDTITNAVFNYTFSNGLTDTIQWSGFAERGDTITINVNPITLTAGFYDFEIEATLINNLPDERSLNNQVAQSFLLTAFEDVQTQNTTVCAGSEALLYASHPSSSGEIRWYSQQNGGTEVGVGNSLVIPNLSTDETYYADIVEVESVGKTDNLTGNGTFSNSTNVALQFDVFSEFLLKSIKVYTNQAGGRRIVLNDENGNQIAQKLINLQQVGENIIELNWTIQPGENYRLSGELNTNYYINTNGTNYPYVIDNVVKIERAIGTSIFHYPFFYDWQIEYLNGCGRVAATASIGNGNIQADFVSSTDSIDLALTSGSVDFTDNSQNATSWFWDFGDGNTSTLQNPTHIYLQPGNYEVHLQVNGSDNCSDAFTQTVSVINFPVSTNGINNLATSINVFPNPTFDIINIEMSLEKNTEVQYQLFNAVGKLVLNTSKQENGNARTSLNISNFPTGIYFLQIHIDGKTTSKKVVKY